MVDPELCDSRHKNEQAEKKLFCGLILWAVKDEERQAEHKSSQHDRPDEPPGLQSVDKIAFTDCATAFATIHSLAYQPPTSKKIPHR